MFDWFFHLLRLKSPREMRELDRQFQRDMYKLKMQMTLAMTMQITDETIRNDLLTKIAAKELENR